jgi:hypothetical protein
VEEATKEGEKKRGPEIRTSIRPLSRERAMVGHTFTVQLYLKRCENPVKNPLWI